MGNSTLFERRLRMITGLILATYLILHLTNHSLGLISLDAMERMREVITVFWRSIFGGALLYGSLITHFLLGLKSLYRRRTLKMATWEKWQIIFGLSIIPLLAGHIAGTWGSRYFLGTDLTYSSVLSYMFSEPRYVIRQFILLCIMWFHACIGLHFFFRLFAHYRNNLTLYYCRR